MAAILKCLIVDDEKPAHLVIQSHISHCEGLVYTDSAYNGKEAILLLQEKKYDVLFLDIEMPLISGLEVLQHTLQRPATIITTAFDHFAFDAYQNDAIDYLLKPISLPRFLKAVEKVKLFWKNRQNDHEEKSLVFKVNGEHINCELSKIVYFRSMGNYIRVFFEDQSIVIYDSLKNILNTLPESSFTQIHKSYIVNNDFVNSIEKEFLILNTESKVPIGRKYEVLVNRIRN